MSLRCKIERVRSEQHADGEIADDRRQAQSAEQGDDEHGEREQHQKLRQNSDWLECSLMDGKVCVRG